MTVTERASYTYIWEYLVDPDKVAEFERAYSPTGTWVELFRPAKGYIRSELHRDRSNPVRFISIDYWRSRTDWESFRSRFSAEFEALDDQYEALTTQEREIGRFDMISG